MYALACHTVVCTSPESKLLAQSLSHETDCLVVFRLFTICAGPSIASVARALRVRHNANEGELELESIRALRTDRNAIDLSSIPSSFTLHRKCICSRCWAQCHNMNCPLRIHKTAWAHYAISRLAHNLEIV